MRRILCERWAISISPNTDTPMPRIMTGFIATALVLPMLSACIIIADGDSSTTKITHTRSDASIPTLRAFTSDGSTVTASLVTNCTSASDFETTVEANSSDRTLTVRRKSASHCSGPARNLQLSWGYPELNLQAGQTVRVTNPVVL